MNAVMKHEDVEVLDAMPSQALVVTDNPYMAMAQQALALGKVEQLDKLIDMQFKWDAEQARKAFIAAMAAFKSSPLLITKDKENKQYSSMYTTLGNLVNTASEVMAQHGLTADWNIEQADKLIRVTCILSHEAGHSKSVTLESAPDTSGAKNTIQQIKSTVTYLRGATFEAVTGLASQEKAGINRDDDGNGASDPISEKDLAWITAVKPLQDYPAYVAMKKEMLADYGGKPDLVPMTVRTAFNRVAELTKPKD